MQEVPLFAQPDTPGETTLDRGSLAIGSEVVVVEPSYGRAPSRAIIAKVIKVARVWVTVEETGDRKYHRIWKFRMDNQTDGSESHYATRFYTPDQFRLHQAVQEAREYLNQQGIRPDYQSPWYTDNQVVILARIVWSAQNFGRTRVITCPAENSGA